MLRFIMKFFLLFTMIFSSGVPIQNRKAIKDPTSDTYQIYPIVRNIQYGSTYLDMTKKVNVIFSSSVDIYTKEKAFDVISLKNTICETSSSLDGNKVNIVLEVLSESTYITSLVEEDLSYINSKIDAYYLEINQNDIYLTAKDSDALFYGLSSLEYVFEQSEEYVRTLKIKDYSQSEYRGFIEGYYGVPWTSKQRQELMRFGARVKTNIYIYAPKDDVYHSTSWRSLYSSKDLKILKEQVETGRESKTRLAWAIHPFMNNPLTTSSYDVDLQIIKNKFDQIYNVGVRQFVFSADDIPLPTADNAILHRRLANDLAAYLKTKGDCYNLVFVPTTYSMIYSEVTPEAYFNVLMDGLDESISIMWTGEKICSRMSNMAFSEFKEYTGGKKPFIWMNWPVNDYAVNYLLLGEGEVYDTVYDNDEDVNFSGIVTNPMQFAEASKLSIWATADYAWNTKDFNMSKSYLDSFKYIEPDEYVSYQHIATHLANASIFDGVWFKESTSLVPLIDAYKEAYTSGSYSEESTSIDTYFANLIDDIDNFMNNASNHRLIDEISPWVIALRYTSLVVKQYLNLINNINTISIEDLLIEYNKLLEYISSSKSQTSPVLVSGKYAVEQKPCYVGRIVIQPFIDYLHDLVIDDIMLKLGYNTGVTYRGFDSIYQGSLDNIVDGDESTYCWFGSHPSSGAYVRVDFGEVKTINDIYVKYGHSEERDMMFADVEISSDAKNWTKVGETNRFVNTIDLRGNPLQARFIRLLDKGTETWVAIKEIAINHIPIDEYYLSYSTISISQGELTNLYDNDPSTFVWFASNGGVDVSLILDLRKVMHVDNFVLSMANEEADNDYLANYSIYVAGSDKVYAKIGDYHSKDIDITINQDIQYIKIISNETLGYWLLIKTLNVNA